MSRRGELAVALALDAVVGEPPAAVHPVIWMGRLARWLERRLPVPGSHGDVSHGVAAGAVAWGVGVAATAGVGAAAARLPWPVRGVLLWPLFAGRMLVNEVRSVEHALDTEGLEAGRERVGRIVSRPTGELDEAEVRMAAIESLAENLSDSYVAPLTWWSVGGLPAAAAYRWIDTVDSLWGYQTPRWQRRGRVAARADDLANLVPARLTALLLRGRLDGALRREAARTASPNAGWPMAAMAIQLGVRLEKRDAYVLHGDGRRPTVGDVDTAISRAVLAGVIAAALVSVLARGSASARRREASGRDERRRAGRRRGQPRCGGRGRP